MSEMKVLVLGGMHGNEELGIKLVRRLKKYPINNVEAVIANPKAVTTKTRFVESDLNRSFGTEFAGTYESDRAIVLKEYAIKFDIVLDFHNTLTANNNCVFVGKRCKTALYQVIKMTGLTNCVEATYDCINKFCGNVISIEISIGDALDNVDFWYQYIVKLSSGLSENQQAKLSVFRFVRRVTWQEQADYQINAWQPFKPINTALQKKMGLSGIIVPIFIESKLTEFYATLLSKERTV